MAAISNLKINERLNVERPITVNGTWKWQIWENVRESAKLRVVRNIEWTNDSKIANFWKQILIFLNW